MGKNKQARSVQKVVVAVTLSNASWRDFLTGFFEYAKRNNHWDIRVVQSTDELERTIQGCQGVVTGIKPNRRTQALIAKYDTPIISVGAEWKLDRRICSFSFIRNDNEDIGCFCAHHFKSLGNFASAGFVPSDIGNDWSAAREKGFFETFGHVNKSTFRPVAEAGSDNDIAALAHWLTSLPKPAAVMAAWDMRAIHVLSACYMARLKVPGQIAVIGVDNDPLLCDFATPPLTSIAPDHALEGRLAGQTIDRMMRRAGNMVVSRHILNTAKKMVERESTKPISPVATLIARALAFIDARASENIKVADVVSALGVSRSLIDTRFREFQGETVAKAISGRRLAEVKRLLAGTNLSIRAITAKCGFANPNHLKNLFKRQYGVSMREWRNDVRSTGLPARRV